MNKRDKVKSNHQIILKEKTINRMENIEEIMNIGAGILSSVNPAFSIIPIFTYAVNWTFGLASPEYIKRRLFKFNEKLEKREIDMEDFKKEIFSLSEHNEYIVLNHLRNILLTSIPETVDIYIDLIIDFIMHKEYDDKETLCEIVNSLNKSDINLLKIIKGYIKNGNRKYYEKNIEQHINEDDDFKSVPFKFKDRNLLMDDNTTIFWKDFKEYNELQVGEMGYILLEEGMNDEGVMVKDWAYIVKSFIKLQNLGLLELDYINTVGNINSLNIERFHITIFGRELLEYID